VTEYEPEINFSLRKAAISNEHCANSEMAWCTILRHTRYRICRIRFPSLQSGGGQKIPNLSLAGQGICFQSERRVVFALARPLGSDGETEQYDMGMLLMDGSK
jgi:hypothetical protein